MCNNLNLSKNEEIRNGLKRALNWKVVSQLKEEEEYGIIISYNSNLSGCEVIKDLGTGKKGEISDKLLKFFDEFLDNVYSFGLLIYSHSDYDKNWDISLLKCEKSK
jgi:hypothetical protein